MKRSRSPVRPRIRLARPNLVQLEDRSTPAIIPVTSLADAGAGSLRAAISQANDEANFPGADTIVFTGAAAGGTVFVDTIGSTNFGPSAFEIKSNVTIQGSIAGTAETIARSFSGPAMRLFVVAPTANLTLDRVVLSNGLAKGGDGGFGGGGGGAGLGGAIFNLGTLNVSRSTFTQNIANGGKGGNRNGDEGGGGGGGMFGNGGIGQQVGSAGGGGGFFGNGGNGALVGQAPFLGGGGGGTQTNGKNGGDGGTGGVANGGDGGQILGTSGGFGGGGGGSALSNGTGGFGGLGGGGGGGGLDQVSALGGTGGFGGGGGGGGNGGQGGFGGGGGGGFKGGAPGFGGGSGANSSTGGGGGGGGAGFGGAIFNEGGTVTILNSTLSGNQARGGVGGLGFPSTDSGANGTGAGAGLFTHGGFVTIRNSTFTENISISGRGFAAVAGSALVFATIHNSVFGSADTIATDLEGDFVGGGSNNLIRTMTGSGSFTGTLTGEPLLGSLANNGGGIPTHLPIANSPLINAGNNAETGGATTDQRGFNPRIVGSIVDIGSVELGATPGSPPVLTAPANQNADEGVAALFQVGSLTDANNSGNYLVTVNWGDGTADTIFTQATAGTLAAQSHKYNVDGTFTVSLIATDADGTSNNVSFTVAVKNSVPILAAAGNQTATEGVGASFNLGTVSDLNNSGNYLVTVNWGDGSANTVFTQPTVGTLTPQNHTFVSDGTYTVTLTATDADGTSSPVTFTVTVANSPPVLTAAGNQTATEGVGATFNLGTVSDLNNSGNYLVTVNWGDGSANTVFTQTTVGTLTPQNHTFAVDGVFTVSIVATDADGTSNTVTLTVNVANSLPVLTAAGNQATMQGVATLFNLGTLADANNSGNYLVTVIWGDGSANTVFTQPTVGTLTPQSHTFSNSGTFTVSIVATDADGTSNPVTLLVNVGISTPILTAPGNRTATEGVGALFNLGTVSDLNNSGNYLVTVNWGDGSANTVFTQPTVGTLTPQNHTFANDGVYTASIVASDADGTSNTVTFTVTVANSPPVLAAAGNQTAVESVARSFDLGTLTDLNSSGNYTVTVNWGDATPPTVFNQTAPGILAPQTHTYAVDGVYLVRVQASDVDGFSNFVTFTVTVADAAPVMTTAPNQTGTEGVTGFFCVGTLADINASNAYAVTVNWGDGSANSFFNVSKVGILPFQPHRYSTSGIYAVSVQATDVNGPSNVVTFTITVADAPPILFPTVNQTSPAGKAHLFTLGSLADPNDSGNYQVTVNWGDGSAATVFPQATTGLLSAQNHTYAAIGTYTVTVVASDVDGVSNATTFSAFVDQLTPTVTPAGNQTAQEAVAGNFALGTISDNNNSGNYTVTINWGDGSAPTVITQPAAGAIAPQPHTYAQDGLYTVTIVASDGDGASPPATLTITVANVLPVVTAPASQVAVAGLSRAFLLGSFTDNPADGPWQVSVNWGDGSAPTVFSQASAGALPTADHKYSQVGTFTVTVSVTDNQGPGAASFTVNVGSALPSVIVAGGQAETKTFSPTGQVLSSSQPFGIGYLSTIRVASADLNNDGVLESITCTGPNAINCILVFDGVTGDLLFSLVPFEDTYFGGVFVTTGDINGDTIPDIVLSPDRGGGPRVKVIDGATFTTIVDFFGIADPDFRGGARTALGDMNFDGKAELIVAAGEDGGPRVAIYDGASVAAGTPVHVLPDFFVFEPTLRNGVYVAAGDINGDGAADLVAAGGPSGGPRVLILSGLELYATGAMLPIGNFFVGDPDSRGGVRVSVKNLDGDTKADLVTGSGAGVGSRIIAYSGAQIGGNITPPTLVDFEAFPGSTDGVFVG